MFKPPEDRPWGEEPKLPHASEPLCAAAVVVANTVLLLSTRGSAQVFFRAQRSLLKWRLRS